MKKDILTRFGQRVRALRRAKGVAQEKMAVLAGLDRSYFGAVERGQRNISLRNVEKIAKSLRCTLRDLMPR